MRASLTVVSVAIAMLAAGCSQSTSPTPPSYTPVTSSSVSLTSNEPGPPATVTAVDYKAGNPTIDLIVAIPSGVDIAARSGRAPFAVVVSLAYVSTTNTFETIEPTTESIANTTLVDHLDARTDLIKVTLSLGTHAVPGGNPGYSATAQIVVVT